VCVATQWLGTSEGAGELKDGTGVTGTGADEVLRIARVRFTGLRVAVAVIFVVFSPLSCTKKGHGDQRSERPEVLALSIITLSCRFCLPDSGGGQARPELSIVPGPQLRSSVRPRAWEWPAWPGSLR
jgi:hypothetical protein